MADSPVHDIETNDEEVLDRETTKLLRRVYSRLRKEAARPIESTQYRLRKLTGLNAKVLMKLREGNDHNQNVPTKIDRGYILKTLQWFYVERKQMPTTLLLFSTCEEFLPAHMDLADFRKLLYKLDFVWKKLPNSSFVVIERPQVTYERHIFLKSINYSINERIDHIYFIEENGYDEAGNYYDYSSMLESKEEVKKIIYAVSNTEIILSNNVVTDLTEKSFKNFVVDELLPKLEKQSAVVFINTDHHSEMLPGFSDLTIESLRCEMTDWLDKNNIPYEENMSKAELFDLIENCTDMHANKYLVDSIIRANGHIPIRLPTHLMGLTPGQQIQNLMNNNLKETDGAIRSDVNKKVPSLLTSIEPYTLKNYLQSIFNEYVDLLNLSILVDECQDGLLLHMHQLVVVSDDEDSDVLSFNEDSE